MTVYKRCVKCYRFTKCISSKMPPDNCSELVCFSKKYCDEHRCSDCILGRRIISLLYGGK